MLTDISQPLEQANNIITMQSNCCYCVTHHIWATHNYKETKPNITSTTGIKRNCDCKKNNPKNSYRQSNIHCKYIMHL